LTHGVLFGLGTGIAYYPVLGILNEWFVKHRGIASGIMFGGAGLSGVVLPILFEKSLTNLGLQLTFRIWAFVMTLTLIPNIHFLLRGRLPES
jgi:MFS family permease